MQTIPVMIVLLSGSVVSVFIWPSF